MTLRTLAAAGLALAAVATSAEPQRFATEAQRVRLVELYTSEGCSSCPPADEWMSRRVDDQRLWREIVPVAFHVDYWDYIGWPDRFASPIYSKRQREHARLGRVRSVYTPGFVVGGKEWRGFFRRAALPRGKGEPVGSLAIELEGSRASARFATPAALGALELHVALLGFGLTTEVGAGENTGRTLEHDFVVLAYGRAYLDPGAEGYVGSVEIPPARAASERQAIAAWVTPVDDTLPIQAVGGWLEPR